MESGNMFKTSWPIMIVALVAGLVAVLSVSLVAVAQQGPSAARSFDKATVAPGGQVVVTIDISGFELGMAVVETLPAGFNYVPAPQDHSIKRRWPQAGKWW
jgi:non-ribosomal peptide synthetase component F